MRIVGAIVLLAYGLLAFTGYQPFSSTQRGKVPQQVRSQPAGLYGWYGGYHGGK